jgi:hypothetical protein
MRWTITSVFVAAFLTVAVCARPLTAQSDDTAAPRNAIGFGFAATLGSGWQIEGGDISYVHRYRGGTIGAFSIGARIGTFIDEAAILGGSRGIVFAPTLALRSSSASLAQLGDEQSGTTIGFDVTLEASGYVASSSPLAQGSHWGAVALLPGIRAGSGEGGVRYGLVIGPTAFIGSHSTTVRGLLGFRIEAPLARRERRP